MADGETKPYIYTEQRVVPRKDDEPLDASVGSIEALPSIAPKSPEGIQIGDRVIIRYLDNNKTASFVLSRDQDDLTNGYVSALSPLGRKLLGSNEEDEVEFEANGIIRKALVVRHEHKESVMCVM